MATPSAISALLLFFSLHAATFPAKANKVCISPGGRFPPFSLEGQPPKRVEKGPKELTLCRIFRKKTCCDVTQTYPALISLRRLASAGEASQECLNLWELLECSICDPKVGTMAGPPVICASLCDSILKACADAYFSLNPKTQVLSPCGLKDILCGKAREWTSNGTEFCLLAGFSVPPPGNSFSGSEEKLCYGKESLNTNADSWKSMPKPFQKEEITGMLGDFMQWLARMPVSERVSWAVGGLVLTAGLLFVSKRKSYSYRQKQAAILRTARMLEVRSKQQSSVSQGSRKSVRRIPQYRIGRACKGCAEASPTSKV